MILVLGYLLAAVLANLTVAHFGPSSVYVVAFVAIGFDLTCRDLLHERWQGRSFLPKMSALILVGSVISFVLNRDALQVGLASFFAFLLAGTSDSVVYHRLRFRSRFVRVNGSNVVSSGVDSLVFPTLAFWGFDPTVTLGQFFGKVLGGLVWAWILGKTIWRPRREDD